MVRQINQQTFEIKSTETTLSFFEIKPFEIWNRFRSKLKLFTKRLKVYYTKPMGCSFTSKVMLLLFLIGNALFFQGMILAFCNSKVMLYLNKKS